MKKIFFCWITLIFLSVALAWAQNFNGSAKQIRIDPPGRSLKTGEYLEYYAEWLGIPAGKIILKVEGIVNFSGHQCYQLSGRAFPNRFFTHFYDVDYEMNSYVDTITFQPLRFEKKRRIKNQFNDTVIDFDRVGNRATFNSKGTTLNVVIFSLQPKITQQSPATNIITKDTQDLLSSLYYFRLHDIEPGKNQISVYYNQRNWPISVETEKPFLKEIPKNGIFSVFAASVSSTSTDFVLGRHKLTVYFTADSRRIPLEFDVGTAIGFIRCRLQKIPE